MQGIIHKAVRDYVVSQFGEHMAEGAGCLRYGTG